MAKNKILLFGKNESGIQSFFEQMKDYFECLSCSVRNEDITSHVKNMELDACVYCMLDETADSKLSMIAVGATLERLDVPFVVYGTPDEIDELKYEHKIRVDYAIKRPSAVIEIRKGLVQFLKDREEDKAAQAALAAFEIAPPAEEKKAEMPVLKGPLESEIPHAPSDAPQMDKNGNIKKHILVVDDDVMMLRLIKEYLSEDYVVATAANGQNALRYLETRSTDLILLDYEMPGISGPLVLKNLREKPKTAGIPVVFLTGITEKEKINMALAHKPQGYLLKPIDSAKLKATISKLI